MKFHLIVIMILSLLYTSQTVRGQEGSGAIHNLLIGTYTKSDKVDGIHVYTFNSKTGEFGYKDGVSGIKNPSFLAISKDRKHLYAVSEVGNGQGSISAYSFDASTGKLAYLNSASSGGDGPCHLTIDDQNKFVFAGNYSGGSLSAIPVNKDGSLSQDIQAITHQGSSVHPNQDKPHVHATVLSPDNQYLFVPDLGTDKINIYSVDVTQAKPLTPAVPDFVKLEAGSGPRHFTFHPNQQYAYVIQELTGTITAFKYVEGKLDPIQSVNNTPDSFNGTPDASDIHISPDGKFLYGSLRGEINELVIYALGQDGKLTYVGRQSTFGDHPRNFVIDPSGNYLLVGNGQSDEIVIFKRDHQTGLLTSTGNKISLGSPVCLKFVAVE